MKNVSIDDDVYRVLDCIRYNLRHQGTPKTNSEVLRDALTLYKTKEGIKCP